MGITVVYQAFTHRGGNGSGVPSGSGMMPSGSGMMPSGSGMMPSGSGMMPSGSGMMPSGSGMSSGALRGGAPRAMMQSVHRPYTVVFS